MWFRSGKQEWTAQLPSFGTARYVGQMRVYNFDIWAVGGLDITHMLTYSCSDGSSQNPQG